MGHRYVPSRIQPVARPRDECPPPVASPRPLRGQILRKIAKKVFSHAAGDASGATGDLSGEKKDASHATGGVSRGTGGLSRATGGVSHEKKDASGGMGAVILEKKAFSRFTGDASGGTGETAAKAENGATAGALELGSSFPAKPFEAPRQERQEVKPPKFR